ncbi:MAG: DegV family protein [Clostridiales bacterium]|nr:DegV family protein [Clostridiales bacterium]
MSIRITSDSSVDLSKELIEKYNIEILPFNILMNDTEYLDGININNQMIIENFKKNGTLPKTSAVSVERYKEFFSEQTKNGDYIIHFSISSLMSCSCDNAYRAKSELNANNVAIIDGQNLSTGTALLMLYANDLIEKGEDFDTIVNKVRARINNVQSSFIIDKLNFLHKGGRCSSIQLLGANIFNIKPSIEVKDGKMGMAKKYRGPFIKVCESYVKDTLTKFNRPDLTRCFITYSTISEEVLNLVKQTLEENSNFKEILITQAGATVTSHCGENTIGILYINDGGENGLN